MVDKLLPSKWTDKKSQRLKTHGTINLSGNPDRVRKPHEEAVKLSEDISEKLKQ